MLTRRHVLQGMAGAGLAGGSSLAPGAAFGEDRFPSKPIRILVPYAPGGATDVAARWVGERVRQTIGQNILIDNKPGAFGIISIEEMARAKPDGYTLMIGNVTTNCITPVMFPKKMSIDYDKDVTAVARLMLTPNILVVTTTNFAPRSVAELIALAKKNPNKIRYASTGIASFPHFDTELLMKRAGIEMIHIPYKGGAGEVFKDVVSGDVEVALLSTPIAGPQVKAGRIFPIAAVTDKRLSNYPDVPTLAEAGFPNVGTVNWSALFAPAKTPPEVIKILFKHFTDVLSDPELVKVAAATGTDMFPAESPEATAKWQKEEMAKWRGIVQEVKIEVPQ